MKLSTGRLRQIIKEELGRLNPISLVADLNVHLQADWKAKLGPVKFGHKSIIVMSSDSVTYRFGIRMRPSGGYNVILIDAPIQRDEPDYESSEVRSTIDVPYEIETAFRELGVKIDPWGPARNRLQSHGEQTHEDWSEDTSDDMSGNW
jgi:hypothetical protein